MEPGKFASTLWDSSGQLSLLGSARTSVFAAFVVSPWDSTRAVSGSRLRYELIWDTCRLGQVTNAVDVSSEVTINGNVATLPLRAKDTCCCNTGWGEDTVAGRLNAKLHWEVELWPPVPISPASSNSANGHFM